ncbi:MAG TPA: 16S rRNA (cytidine(1402)-2'-O)-methyltransferase, partial [Prosthecobacter sp.]
KKGARTTELTAALQRDCTSVFFESPYRLVDTLAILAAASADRRVVVARELTKKFEEFRRGPANILLSHFQNKAPKGEITLLIAPSDPPKWLTW